MSVTAALKKVIDARPTDRDGGPEERHHRRGDRPGDGHELEDSVQGNAPHLRRAADDHDLCDPDQYRGGHPDP